MTQLTKTETLLVLYAFALAAIADVYPGAQDEDAKSKLINAAIQVACLELQAMSPDQIKEWAQTLESSYNNIGGTPPNPTAPFI